MGVSPPVRCPVPPERGRTGAGHGRWAPRGRAACAGGVGTNWLPSLPDGGLWWPPADLPGESHLSPLPSWRAGASVSS